MRDESVNLSASNNISYFILCFLPLCFEGSVSHCVGIIFSCFEHGTEKNNLCLLLEIGKKKISCHFVLL